MGSEGVLIGPAQYGHGAVALQHCVILKRGSRRNLAPQTRDQGAPDARVVAALLGARKRGALLCAKERQRLVFVLGLLENLQDITQLLFERGDFGNVEPEVLPRLGGRSNAFAGSICWRRMGWDHRPHRRRGAGWSRQTDKRADWDGGAGRLSIPCVVELVLSLSHRAHWKNLHVFKGVD